MFGAWKHVKQRPDNYLASLPGVTPLGVAALVGDESLVEMLLECGAEILANDRGDLPEALAATHRHVRVLRAVSLESV